ncbi:hypothetical protein MNB_SV-14-1809 [hydrothermal vent metagenome]|uniref:Uncharacterized protein n=1 Tax=hydrothermal vent metagenome TaxID=652676 RepID=A0A1W1BRM4_9ZZZZ
MYQQSKSLGRDWLESQSKKYNKIVSNMKSFFVVINGSEDVLYLKCKDIVEAVSEVKRYLGVVELDNNIEIIY